MREFDTGATRDDEGDKPDYEGFLSPLVMEAFGRYMNKHRKQADGKIRDSDNWQKGIPQEAYMKSAWRHLVAWWQLHRGGCPKETCGKPVSIEDSLCALMFNVQGYLHEHLKRTKR